jgi:uncharacterized membrane protein
MTQHHLYLVSVWIHILAAMVWIGGAGFIALVLVPALRREDLRAQSPEILRTAAIRFRTVGWISLSVLVVTGLTNLMLRGIPLPSLSDGAFYATRFGHALGAKLILVALILGIGAVHDFILGPRAAAAILKDPCSRDAARARRKASMMGRFTLLLGLAVVAIAVALARGY